MTTIENDLVEIDMDIKKVIALIETSNIEFVRIELCDMYGISRSKIVPARHFPRTITAGTAFSLGAFAWDPVCSLIPGTGLLEEVGYCDMTIHPDLDTFRVIPWLENTARVLVDSTFQGAPVVQDPRHIARTQLDKLERMGLSLFSAHEYEFYVREKSGKMLSDFGGESLTITSSEHSTLVYKLMRELTRVGIDIETFHSEDGAGQLEVTFRPSFGLKAADNAHTFRTSVKEICQSQGYTASFMSKPFEGVVGSSCHFCHSLWDLEGRQTQLYDEESKWQLSEVGQYWIAGLLEHAPSIALLCAPTINCLKRFQPETFAPVNATWGVDNRTAAIRLKVDGSGGTYIENRMGASASNPYLLLAATVAAGIDGIERKLKLPEPMANSAYNPKLVPNNVKKLPTTLPEAIQNFVADDLMFETFGADFIKTFVALKQHEMKRELEAKGKGKSKDWEMDFFFKIL
ncbi:lengsin-like isoform X2 [Apostichopus japonicus]|uniref:lengsin-like isoform X2 n=1 Tax=Stichopus japonicus TaxID=307972 RepID=UPI003AB75F53